MQTAVGPARPARLPSLLRPVEGVAARRIGPDGDGGYVVAADVLPQVRWILSLGLGDDWRFERDLQQCTGAPLDVYDHTVTERFWLRRSAIMSAKRVIPGSRVAVINEDTGYLRYRRFFQAPDRTHHRVAVGYPGTDSRSLAQILAGGPDSQVFLKSDIEGWEWRILDDVVAHRDRLVGIAMEFHDVDLLVDRLTGFVAAMPEFAVIAVSANNFGCVAPDGTPQVVEVSLARRDLLTDAPGAVVPPPQPNVRYATPIEISFGD